MLFICKSKISIWKKIKDIKLDFCILVWYIIKVSKFGELAQLGERSAGSRKVRGSSPLFSTKFIGCCRMNKSF